MNERDTGNPAYERAKKRVDDIRGWYVHVVVYLLVNGGLFALDLATGDGIQWAIWPLIGWGIGLAIHTAILWLEAGPLGHDWEDRKIDQIMERDARRHDRTGGEQPR